MKFKYVSIVLIIFMSFATLTNVVGDEKNNAWEAIQANEYKKALKILNPLAKKGDIWAQWTLGIMHRDGIGLPQNYNLAFKWHSKAAKKGFVNAQFSIGVMYLNGLGVSKNFKIAKDWFIKASDQKHKVAPHNIGVMYDEGHGVTQDDLLAFKWYSKAAERGYIQAQYNLGVLLLDEQSPLKNYIKSHMWINLSYLHANDKEISSRSRNTLSKLEKTMTKEQIVKAQELASQCYEKKFKGC